MAELEARRADIHYDEIECKSALNPVKGMGFNWSLNPYVGCEHRCSFCYVRAYELRADRPHDDRYGRSIRVKTNVAQVLRCELARRSWKKETVVIGAATDPYQPAEGRFKLTRQCLEALRDFSNPAGIITRGPMIVRDIDVLTELAKRADLGVPSGGHRRVGRHAASAPGHPRAFHERARAPLARARAAVRAHVPRPPVPACCIHRAVNARGGAAPGAPPGA